LSHAQTYNSDITKNPTVQATKIMSSITVSRSRFSFRAVPLELEQPDSSRKLPFQHKDEINEA